MYLHPHSIFYTIEAVAAMLNALTGAVRQIIILTILLGLYRAVFFKQWLNNYNVRKPHVISHDSWGTDPHISSC